MTARPRNDEGGIWIKLGIALGIFFYAMIVLMLIAGVTAVLPLIVVPPAIAVMIALNGFIGGPRRPQPVPRPIDEHGGTPAETLGGAQAVAEGPEPSPLADDAPADVSASDEVGAHDGDDGNEGEEGVGAAT